MTRITPLRLTIWQYSHLRLTDALTFIKNPLYGLIFLHGKQSLPSGKIPISFKMRLFVINTQKNLSRHFSFQKNGNKRQVLHYTVKIPFSPDIFTTDSTSGGKAICFRLQTVCTQYITLFLFFKSVFKKNCKKKFVFFYLKC